MTSSNRTVVYMPRSLKSTRSVVNDFEIIEFLRKNLHPSYELVIAGHTQEYKTVEALHESWRTFAQIFSNARVIIGPHGGAFNNLMWAPQDVDYVEFNEFPDDDVYSQSHGETPVRCVFLTAAWAKGGTGKFWIVEPSMKHPSNFYVGKLRIAPLELVAVLLKIGGILKSEVSLSNYKSERHGTWKQPNPCYNCIPPPVGE